MISKVRLGSVMENKDIKYDIHKIGGILLKNKKLLISRSKNKDFFIAPGGKIEKNESVKSALVRELKEELGIIVEKDSLEKFGTFYDSAAGKEKVILKMDVFIVERWRGEIIPSNEIEEVRWIDSNYSQKIKIGSIFQHQVIPKSKELKLIN